MPRGERFTRVELVEDDGRAGAAARPDPAEPSAADAPAGGGPEVHRTRFAWWRRRGWLALVGAVVVAALALVGTQAVLDARAAAVDARIAALPGATADAGEELTPLWTLDGEWRPVTAVDRVAVGIHLLDDGALAVTARDLDDGAEAWSTAVSDPVPEPLRPNAYGSTSCVPPPGGSDGATLAPEVVVCFLTDAFRSEEYDPGRLPQATWSELVTVDLRDGSIRSRADVAPSWSAAVLESVTALAWLDEDLHVVVAGVDTATGAERWRYRAEQPEPALDEGSNPAWLSVSEAGGHALVFTGAGAVFAVTPDGERRDDVDMEMTFARPGRLVVETDEPTVSRVLRVGRPDLEVLGSLADRVVDDGTVPGLEVSSSGGFVWGWDADSGEQLWRATVTGSVSTSGASVVVAEGRVHTTTASGAVALDARTGEVLWSYDLPGADAAAVVDGRILCDGPHVMFVHQDSSLESPGRLVVLDRRTGAHVRTLSAPGGSSWLSPLGHRIVGSDYSDAVVLG